MIARFIFPCLVTAIISAASFAEGSYVPSVIFGLLTVFLVVVAAMIPDAP